MSELPTPRPPGIVDLKNLFAYHSSPKAEDLQKFKDCRKRFLDLARWVSGACSLSAERTIAIRKIHEAMMAANCAIALDLPIAEDPDTGDRLQT